MLKDAMRRYNKSAEVPASFPELKALNDYRNPTVSTPEQIQNLRGLRSGWDKPLDQAKLRVLLRQRFNIWTKGYLKHLGPVFVVKDLARCRTDENRVNNMRFDIQLKRLRKKKTDDGEEPPAQSETKITFYPLTAVDIDLSREPEEEDWSTLGTKAVPRFDPAARVEAEILTCFLKHGLPEGSLQEPEPAPRARKKVAASDPAASTDLASAAAASTAPSNTPASQQDSEAPTTASASNKRSRPKKDKTQAASDAAPAKRKKKSTKDAEKVVIPPPATFKAARTIVFKQSSAIDLGGSDSEDELPAVGHARRFAPPANNSRGTARSSGVSSTGAAVIDLGDSDSDDALPDFCLAKPVAPLVNSRQAPRRSRKPPLTTSAPRLNDDGSSDYLPMIDFSGPTARLVRTCGPPFSSLSIPDPPPEAMNFSDSSDDELPDIVAPRPAVPQVNHTLGNLVDGPQSLGSSTALTPGETVSRETLRPLRVASFATPRSSGQAPASVAMEPSPRIMPKRPIQHEVIDLT